MSHIGSIAIDNIWAKVIEKAGFIKMSSSDSRYSFNWGYTAAKSEFVKKYTEEAKKRYVNRY